MASGLQAMIACQGSPALVRVSARRVRGVMRLAAGCPETNAGSPCLRARPMRPRLRDVGAGGTGPAAEIVVNHVPERRLNDGAVTKNPPSGYAGRGLPDMMSEVRTRRGLSLAAAFAALVLAGCANKTPDQMGLMAGPGAAGLGT